MSMGYSWTARWADPLTGLPSGISSDGYSAETYARADALARAPMHAEISVYDPQGRVLEVIPSRAKP
jgi:hypothetical protein